MLSKLISSKECVTAVEISRQPDLWQEVLNIYRTRYDEINAFFSKIEKKHPRIKVIFAGAGSSAYVSDSTIQYLRTVVSEKYELLNVPTTDLVSLPYCHFNSEIPTILVSFARSGNSPESVASVELGKNIIKDFYQITITCASKGRLAQNAAGDMNNLLLLMPDLSNDQGFAMTGSFTSMMLAVLLTFERPEMKRAEELVSCIIDMGRKALEKQEIIYNIIQSKSFDRVVYLGAGGLCSIARESQLKILELTAGKVSVLYDTPMGFRHGPKSFLTKNTLVLTYLSGDPYTRIYDTDLVNELGAEENFIGMYTVSSSETELKNTVNICLASSAAVPDAYAGIPFVIIAQLLALFTSLKTGINPDNPSPKGIVNRVVKGVEIHPFNIKRGN